jgi:hypothetical protein
MRGVPTPMHPRLGEVVEHLLQESSPQFLIDHAHRSFQLALLIADDDGLDLDVEVLHAGVLLHDLGLTARFRVRGVRFEVAGANAARELVLAHGMEAARAKGVWDVAALHGTPGIAEFKSPEASVGARAIGLDVAGVGLERFDPDQVGRIMATRPGFAEPFIRAVVACLRDDPQAASSTWMSTVAADHIPGFRQSSVERLALAHPFENAAAEVHR